MLYRLLFFIFLFSLTLIASCIPQNQTESREGLLYASGSTIPFEGCILQHYPDGQKKAELFFHNGEPTGTVNQWYDNGQKESEIIYRSGKLHTKKLWNIEGYMYTFERYKDGELLQPIEMTYHQAIVACQQASFGGYRDWQLPNVKELYKVPFSEATKEMTLIASNPPVKLQNDEEVSYVRFGATPETARWDNDDLVVERALNVICIREGKPHIFHLIMGLNGIADLASRDMDEYIRVAAPKQAPVAKKKSVKEKTVKKAAVTTPKQPPVTKKKSVKEKTVKKAAVTSPKQPPVTKKKSVKEKTVKKAAVTSPKQPPVAKKKSVKEKTVKKAAVTTPKQVPVVKKHIPQEKSVKKAATTVPKQTPVTTKKSVKERSIRSGYYINIYTFSKYPPEKAQLNKISLGGYRYTYSDVIINGEKLTRVLVGPFPNEKKAKKELKRVQSTIASDAYILDNRY